MKPYAERFYKSKVWKDCSRSYLQSKGYLCEECLKHGIHRPAALVHHVIHLTPENINIPEIALGFDNLEAVCIDCHAAIHASGQRRPYKLDDMGRVLPR